MYDARVMPVSYNVAHARTYVIDAAAAAVAATHTIDVKRAYKHVGLKDISRASTLLFPSSANLWEAEQHHTRLFESSASNDYRVFR